MGSGFVIIFWGIILAFFALVWLGLVALTILGWNKKKAWLKWCAGIPAVIMLLIGVTLGGFIASGILRSMNPKAVFKDTFGVPPAPVVADIKSDVYWFADTGSIYLRFKTTEDDFRKLKLKGLVERTMDKMKEEVPFEIGSKAPVWWTYEYRTDWIYLLRQGSYAKQNGFISETEYFAYDRKNQLAYYLFLGID